MITKYRVVSLNIVIGEISVKYRENEEEDSISGVNKIGNFVYLANAHLKASRKLEIFTNP